MFLAILAEKSVGKAIASSNALVCNDCVPPKAAAAASIQVRATLLYNNLIRQNNLQGKYPLVASGGKIKFVYLKLPNTLRENVIAFPADEVLPPEFGLDSKVDRDLQWDKTMIASTQIILDAIGWAALS